MPLAMHIQYGHIVGAFTRQRHDCRHALVRCLRRKHKQREGDNRALHLGITRLSPIRTLVELTPYIVTPSAGQPRRLTSGGRADFLQSS